jgi:capsular polysaccharide biosynthesis protein
LHTVINRLALDKVWAGRIFERSDPLSAEEAEHYLERHLRPKFKHDSDTIEVTALSDDPDEAAQIANDVVEEYQAVRDREGAESLAGSTKGSDAAKDHVVITSRAVVPTVPTHPDRRFCYAIAAALGGMLSVMVASAIEVCLLIARAEEAAREMLPPR